MFSNFDFSLLDDPEFKEDSVREELVAPFLNALGYSAAGPARIVRSQALTHPFVYIGTRKYEVKVIPDYVLHPSPEHRWVLDAKAPKEKIRNGKNVEQAFSYAIHPDIRAFVYALCNGHELVIFSVQKKEPILIVALNEIQGRFTEVKNILSPLAFSDPKRLTYKPDFGLFMLKLGWSDKLVQHFVPIGLPFIAKIADEHYSAVVNMKFGEEWYCISFDFDEKRYQQLLTVIDSTLATEIRDAIKRQPFKIALGVRAPVVLVEATFSDKVQTNEWEDFVPLVVIEFKGYNPSISRGGNEPPIA